MIKGFDTIARMDLDKAAALRSLGYEFAIRYCVPGYAKSITSAEADALLSAGLKIGLCWETTASRARAGAAAGLADGRSARDYAAAIGAPEGTVIFFAVDYNAPKADYDKIAAYMIAAATSCRPYRLGIYGPYHVIEEMEWREIGSAYWQCVAWSDGQWSSHAKIQQRQGNVPTGIVTIDVNTADSMAGMWSREEEPMLYKFVPAEMGIYVNRNKKTITQIKAELGCDIICNLNLYNRNWTGACYTRADWQVVGTDGYGYFGFGFDRNDEGFSRAWSGQDNHRNFFGCWDLIVSGEVNDGPVPEWTSDYRRRTVIGMTADGKCFIYCNPTVETVPQLAARLKAAGAVEAIVLDGGGSTQCITPNGTVVSSDPTPRKVHTLFWANLTVKKPVCPYAEPTRNVGKWCLFYSKDMAKWVQWQLNRHGATLEIDGKFGPLSDSALRAFQRTHVDEEGKPLDADGVCGQKTRWALKR